MAGYALHRIGARIYAFYVATSINVDHSAQPGEVIHVSSEGITVACGGDAVSLTDLQKPVR